MLFSLGLRKKLLSGEGFEPTPPFGDQNARRHFLMGRFHDLKSGALDRSAILTRMVWKRYFLYTRRLARHVSVKVEPRSTFISTLYILPLF